MNFSFLNPVSGPKRQKCKGKEEHVFEVFPEKGEIALAKDVLNSLNLTSCKAQVGIRSLNDDSDLSWKNAEKFLPNQKVRGVSPVASFAMYLPRGGLPRGVPCGVEFLTLCRLDSGTLFGSGFGLLFGMKFVTRLQRLCRACGVLWLGVGGAEWIGSACGFGSCGARGAMRLEHAALYGSECMLSDDLGFQVFILWRISTRGDINLTTCVQLEIALM